MPYGSVPFYQADVQGSTLTCVGFTQDWDSVHVDGDASSNDYIAYYIKDNQVMGACAQGRNKDAIVIHEAIS